MRLSSEAGLWMGSRRSKLEQSEIPASSPDPGGDCACELENPTKPRAQGDRQQPEERGGAKGRKKIFLKMVNVNQPKF